MCGIVGVISKAPVNQLIYDALLLLQHRGQDAAGIVTAGPGVGGSKFYMHKAKGMVKDVFRTRNMRALPGTVGLGQVRYPTAGNADNEEEAQPFYVNAPFGIVMVHNGNLTNAHRLKNELFELDRRHINTESDSEVLLNVLAHEIDKATRGLPLKPDDVFESVRRVHRRIKGSYAVISMIAGHGLLAFRDPFGIRPLCIGRGADGTYMVASESVALEGLMTRASITALRTSPSISFSTCAAAMTFPVRPCISPTESCSRWIWLANTPSTASAKLIYRACVSSSTVCTISTTPTSCSTSSSRSTKAGLSPARSLSSRTSRNGPLSRAATIRAAAASGKPSTWRRPRRRAIAGSRGDAETRRFVWSRKAAKTPRCSVCGEAACSTAPASWMQDCSDSIGLRPALPLGVFASLRESNPSPFLRVSASPRESTPSKLLSHPLQFTSTGSTCTPCSLASRTICAGA